MYLNKITIFIPTYNEEKRILTSLKSIPVFFDEIILYDKGSIDKTLDIAKTFEKVIIKKIPFSNKGEENYKEILSFAKNEWVFFMTSSEILSENIFQKINQTINENPEIELIMVPREMYVFQSNFKGSPWGIQYFPFCFQKSKIKFSKNVHELFYVESEQKKYFLRPTEETLVKHITHNSFNKYYDHIEDYIKNEFEKYKDTSGAIQKCKDQILLYEDLLKSNSVNKTMHFAAWSIYWNSIILKILDSKYNIDFEGYDYHKYLDFIERKKDFLDHEIKPSNFMIISLKKFYRKYYKFKLIRKLANLYIKH